jgi:hypothetical protein
LAVILAQPPLNPGTVPDCTHSPGKQVSCSAGTSRVPRRMSEPAPAEMVERALDRSGLDWLAGHAEDPPFAATALPGLPGLSGLWRWW